VLPAHARLRRREDFTRVFRTGSRAGRSTLVVHASLGRSAPVVSELSSTAVPGLASAPEVTGIAGPPGASVQAGFVVSKAVGNAVIRHRVARQLRHLVRDRLTALPPGSAVVVRALPAAAGQSSEVLGRDLDAALRRVLSPRGPSPARKPGAGSAGGPAPAAGAVGGSQ
jgi:ribonuclease P protein component